MQISNFEMRIANLNSKSEIRNSKSTPLCSDRPSPRVLHQRYYTTTEDKNKLPFIPPLKGWAFPAALVNFFPKEPVPPVMSRTLPLNGILHPH